MKGEKDKIAKEFYKRRYKELSDEEKFDVRMGVEDMKLLRKRFE